MVYLPSKSVISFGCKQNSIKELINVYNSQQKNYQKDKFIPSTGWYKQDYHKYKEAKYHCLSKISSTNELIWQDYFFIPVRDSIHANLIISDYNKVIEYLKTQQVKE